MKHFGILLFMVIGLAASNAMAQSVTGSVVGTVTDPSGAVLPGVAIKLSRVETGFQREALTNERGDYQFVLIPVGVYAIQAELPGFKTDVRQGITIQTDIRSRVDFRMQVGELAEKITVTEDAPLLRSETSEVGTVINNRTVQELPLNGRQFQSLAFASPGVTLPSPGSTIAFRGSIVVAGKRETSNIFILDGIDITQQNVRQPILQPSIDSLQEFKLQTWNYTAEFGRQSGGQINMSTKSGTNEFRGVLFEFGRNSAMDAKNFFDVKTQPIPILQRHNFGGNLGGRIVKDRTFFFGNFEGLRERRSFTRTATVPLPEFWNGDFSALLRQPRPIQLVDPLSPTKAPFSGNIIPANRINAISLLTKPVYPGANLGAPGQLTQNFVASAKRVTRQDTLVGRVDHRFNDNQNIFARYSYEYTTIFDPYDEFAGLSDLPAFPRSDRQHNQALSINETWAITPTAINEFRIGLSRFKQWRRNTNTFDFNGAANLLGFDRDPINFAYSTLTIPGYTIGKTNLPTELANTRYQFVDSISLNRGAHTMKAGADIILDRIYKLNNSGTRGSYNFSGGLSGYSFADFLLGTPVSGSRSLGDSHTWMSFYTMGFYFQDDWKFTPRLTFNLGLRYDIFTPLIDKVSQRWTRYNVATRTLEIAGTAANPRRDYGRPDRVYPSLIAASANIKQADLGKNYMWDINWRDFGPRAGFAYRLSDRTVIRGGYGIFWEMNQTGAGGPQGIGNNFPFMATQAINTNQNNPNFFFRGGTDPFANALAGDISLSSVDPNMVDPYIQNWNFGIEREVLRDLMLDVSYVGSKSTHLVMSRAINQPYTDGDSRTINARRPIPGIGNINQTENSADANFHSLQTKVEKRFSSGLQFTVSHLWGHSIDNHSGIGGEGSSNGFQSAWDIRNNRGRSTFDIRQRLSINYIYEVPWGRGRRFLSGISPLANAFLGGWQLGGIAQFQTGNPLTIGVTGNNSNTGGSDRADVAPDVNPKLDNPAPEKFFNTDAFKVPARLKWGNSGRNIIDGPGVQQFDINIGKDFKFGETRRAQFRAEIFNILNHPNFFPPNTTVNNPNFGKILGTGNFTSRQIQLGLKIYY